MSDAPEPGRKEDLRQSIREALWKIHELEQTVQHFTSDSQDVLEARINELVTELQRVHERSSCLSKVEVPVNLLRFMDQGGNPDEFTKNIFTECMMENERGKGKVDALRGSRSDFLQELQSVYPDAHAAYTRLHAPPKNPAN